MKWLQTVARLVASENLPVVWTTPTNFPVFMSYYEMESRRVKTKIGDSTVKLTVNSETKKISKRRLSSSISPNFIHSLDSAMLQEAVVLAKKRGIHNISTVHDCFGILCSDAVEMNKCIREAFVNMYDKPVLENFRDQISKMLSPKNREKIPPLPNIGNLNLNLVLESDFFCS
jgi:DNA-directed RNA polymerase